MKVCECVYARALQCLLVRSVIRLHLGAICVSGFGLRHTGAPICGNANTCLTYEGVESQKRTKKEEDIGRRNSATAADFLRELKSGLC